MIGSPLTVNLLSSPLCESCTAFSFSVPLRSSGLLSRSSATSGATARQLSLSLNSTTNPFNPAVCHPKEPR